MEPDVWKMNARSFGAKSFRGMMSGKCVGGISEHASLGKAESELWEKISGIGPSITMAFAPDFLRSSDTRVGSVRPMLIIWGM